MLLNGDKSSSFYTSEWKVGKLKVGGNRKALNEDNRDTVLVQSLTAE